ncbi:MAG TPA: phosphoenolpyruvate carboxylase, partial [Thermomicrobiales bacterium]|nr:phosphoenolpyruvate carboxylase [Thermomicrobiales bacterium]
RFWPRIREEHERTAHQTLRVAGHERPLAGEPVLRRSIDRRNPYVDPLSFVQAAALRRLRADPEDDEALRTVLLTVNGIAGGLKNTG